MNGSQRLALSSDASVAALDGEAVVLHLRTGRFFRVNRAGTPLLAAIQRAGGATRDELVRSLASEFGIDDARAGADVDAWLSLARSAGLVVEAPPSPVS